MPTIQDIDGILAEMDDIVAWTLDEGQPLGFFAFLYRAVTAEIRSAVIARQFEDNERMIALDVAFARLYIDALAAYREGGATSRCWRVAFEASSSDATIMQHLILGMNAHINFDLGIAAASIARGSAIDDLRADFEAVNAVLWRLTNRMQRKLGAVSPLLFLLDWIGKRRDEQIIDFSIEKARGHAWRLAQDLALAGEARHAEIVAAADRHIELLARMLLDPPGRLLPFVLRLIRRFESRDVTETLRVFGA